MRQAVGYLRVSTGGQGKSGLGLEAQRTAIEAFAAGQGVGQHRTEPLVLDNGCLVDPLQPVKGAVGQVDAVMADRQTTIGVVENGHPHMAPMERMSTASDSRTQRS